MIFYRNKNLSFNLLNKLYFTNLVASIAIILVVAFGIYVKISDVKKDILVNNSFFKNIIEAHTSDLQRELIEIKNYIDDEKLDTMLLFEYAVNKNNNFYSFYILDPAGNVKLSTISKDRLSNFYMNFFSSKPWEGNFKNDIFRSNFSFHDSAVASRFLGVKLRNGDILIAEIKYDFIYDELMQSDNLNLVNSFVTDLDGNIIVHKNIEFVIKQQNVFDLYNIDERYINEERLYISSFNAKQLDMYFSSHLALEDVYIVTYTNIKDIFAEDLVLLIISFCLLCLCIFLVFLDTKLTKDRIIKPVAYIKNLIHKISNNDKISRYINVPYISDFNEIIDGVVGIYKRLDDESKTRLEYEKKLSCLLGEAPLIVLIVDAKSGEILDCSRVASKFYGVSKNEMIGKNLAFFNANSTKDLSVITCDENENLMVYETKQNVANSAIKDVLISKKSIDLNGHKISFCLIQDITDTNNLKQNFIKEKELGVNSPILQISWKTGFMDDITSVSDNVKNILGYGIKEVLDKNFDFKKLIYPDDLDEIINDFNIKMRFVGLNLIKRDYETIHNCRMIKKNSEIINCSVFIKFISGENKTQSEVVGYFIENKLFENISTQSQAVQTITEQKPYEAVDYKALAIKYKSLVTNLFTYSKEGIALVGTDGNVIEINEMFSVITGYARDEIVSKPIGILKSGMHDYKFYADLWKRAVDEGCWSGNIWNKRKNGEKYLEFLTVTGIYNDDGILECFLAIFSDITSIKAREDELEKIAYYDHLTGLPNRIMFHKKLKAYMEIASKQEKSLAIIYIDIDDFKPINDIYGHSAGDKFLVEISKNIASAIGENDLLARISGDEFVAIINDISDKDAAEDSILRILRAALKDVYIDYKKIQISVSIGASIYSKENFDIDANLLLEQADWAMYQSKISGKNRYHIFNEEVDKNFKADHTASDRVEISLANNEFIMLYQPIFDIKKGEISGLDSCIKWKSEYSNPILFDENLPFGCDSSSYDELTLWSIKKALEDQKTLKVDYGLDLKISIKASMELICKPAFIDKFRLIATSKEFDNLDRLEFDISNKGAYKYSDQVKDILKIYTNHGISLAIDDFGSSSSSLKILKEIDADRLKVSKCLSLGAVSGVDNLIILHTILNLSNTFSKDVVATGVETSSGMSLLIKSGYHKLQGNYIATYMKVEKIKKWADSYKLPPQFRDIKPMSEADMMRCNLSIMHRVWIRSLLYMLSSANLSKFNSKDFLRDYSNSMVSLYKRHLHSNAALAIHPHITDLIGEILSGVEQNKDISKLIIELKQRRDELLELS